MDALPVTPLLRSMPISGSGLLVFREFRQIWWARAGPSIMSICHSHPIVLVHHTWDPCASSMSWEKRDRRLSSRRSTVTPLNELCETMLSDSPNTVQSLVVFLLTRVVYLKQVKQRRSTLPAMFQGRSSPPIIGFPTSWHQGWPITWVEIEGVLCRASRYGSQGTRHD
jgi:hypothetical protein